MRDRDPAHLHPYASAKMAQHLSLAQEAGIPVALCETWRDPALQGLDWRKGRDEHGNIVDAAAIVTQARPGQSWHNPTRWARICSDCGHDGEEHGPTGDQLLAFRSCTACGHRCLAANVIAWTQVPASFAWHFYVRDGAGGLEGLGASALTDAAKEHYVHLGALAKQLGVRWGGDFDDDGIPFEKGEWDLGHFEARPPGATLSQVVAVLSIKGGDLVMDRGGFRA